MERPTLLITDESDTFYEALRVQLQDSYQICRCIDGQEALDFMKANKPDILVLDLMLRELDGISLLQQLVRLGISPMVLVTTRLVNQYVVDTLTELGVGYVMLKPCNMTAAAERIRHLSRHLNVVAVDLPTVEDAASELLSHFNFSSRLHGTALLREALIVMAHSPGISITKELYITVGAHFGCNSVQVERAIRTAITQAWEHRTNEVWERFFPRNQNDQIPRPSNGTFITRLAEDIRARCITPKMKT